MVGAVTLGWLSMLEAALAAAAAMVVMRCTSVHGARQSVDWQVLLVIAASIALGRAMETTGVASLFAKYMVELASGSPYTTLAVLFMLTAAFSALISNVAAAVLMFPIAAASSAQLGVDLTPFAVTLMIAASASFATPIGYQTNLMVYGPGDYRFIDFVRMGTPLTVLIGITTVLVVPVVWPFH